ncbi:hypothetical protein ELY33_05000 [Vreelandella andesensis]|uniref:DNA-binding protein n=1 Tax=Vreelandella andesensis TaxID=447567 RepID=A0A433KSU2_9GAMM|nr:hypothetical protein [Halomonas andesensis]RUR32740.1 hypothetical protein ELY33_05000 [Halomonas andesensis]
MRLTISAAARLYGIHRATLHRHIKAGRLSYVFQPDGSRALDLSELIRCYGEPLNQPECVRQDATGDATPHATGNATPHDSQLLDEMRKQTAVIERMAERIERLEAALLRLPAPAEPTPPADTHETEPTTETAQSVPLQVPADSETRRQPPKDFSDLLARFETRTRH